MMSPHTLWLGLDNEEILFNVTIKPNYCLVIGIILKANLATHCAISQRIVYRLLFIVYNISMGEEWSASLI